MNPSIDAEFALKASNYLKAASEPRQTNRRKLWRRPKIAPEDQFGFELMYPRAVAITEDYLLKRVVRRLAPTLLDPIPPPSPTSTDPLVSRLRKAAKSYPDMMKMWSEDMPSDPALLTTWPAFEDARSLRHVLVHRLGYWQPGLDSKPTLNARIRTLGANPDIYRGKVPVSRDDLRDVIDLIHNIVASIDPSS